MSLALHDLGVCFEGVIPSVISTVSGDGMPNISYLSHVVQVDAAHVALSNQFFGKTSANLRSNPRAAILLADSWTGAQYRLESLFVRSETAGVVFDQVETHLKASSAQVGMANVMRLRAVDVFLVTAISQVPFEPFAETTASEARPVDMRAVSRIAAAISNATELGEIVDAVLDGVMRELDCHAASVLLCEAARPVLTTIGTRGYGRTGIGSEAPIGEGVIGSAAAVRRAVKISDLSRVRRFGDAVRNSLEDEGRSRAIALPGLKGAQSQLAVPIEFHRRLLGVLLVESRNRLAFGRPAEVLIDVVARLAGASIAYAETAGHVEVPIPAVVPAGLPADRAVKVVHHVYDDSVFIDDSYVIKGVAGRLLMLILEVHLQEGRMDFTNRELRLHEATRLPDFKDNLETRLLLLRRRLEEKQAPLRLLHVGRGQLRLELRGQPAIQHI